MMIAEKSKLAAASTTSESLNGGCLLAASTPSLATATRQHLSVSVEAAVSSQQADFILPELPTKVLEFLIR